MKFERQSQPPLDPEPSSRPSAKMDAISDGAAGPRRRPQNSDIRRIVDAEIIPRLMMLHGAGLAKDVTPKPQQKVAPSQVLDFARLLVKDDKKAIQAFIKSMLARGCTVERLLLELFAPAAQQLGVWWEDDSVDFVDVTIGASALHRLVYELRPSRTLSGQGQQGRILFSPAPKEQHTFGLLLLGEYFVARGWEVASIYTYDEAEFGDLLSSEHWDFIGFSLASAALIDELATAIERSRRMSRNLSVKVLVGGSACIDDPNILRKSGADFSAGAPSDAVAYCKSMRAGESVKPN
ncbi:MAG: hypothetical protein AAF732_06490 [Pseudomonadota bacterium]